MTELRYYQREAVDAVFDYWEQGGGNPIVDLATGTGKSICIATLVRELCERWPGLRILMLVHVKELVEQNAKAMIRDWPQAPIGINSAGLGRRDWHSQILFASVQSIHKHTKMLGTRDLVVIDEAHLVPRSGEGMYLKLIEGLKQTTPDLRIVGFTATPYRLGSGRLDEGDGRLFDDTVYTYGVAQGVADGFLSPLISKATRTSIDVSNVPRRGGEFVESDLQAAVDIEAITQAAVEETIEKGQDRRSWLLFCTGVDHADHVKKALVDRGISAATVTGETATQDRARIFRDFKEGRIRALCGANVFTTGFDAPRVDLIAMLRPTTSTSLYIQICGRGTRLAEGKANCLVLDYAGNVRRHGPVDSIVVRGKSDVTAAGGGVAPTKQCPDCEELVAAAVLSCPVCGHEWPKPAPKITATADTAPIMIGNDPRDPWTPITDVQYRHHCKDPVLFPDAKPSLRVDYFCGKQTYSEWVCFEHDGFARQKAVDWWNKMKGADPIPSSVDEAWERASDGETLRPTKIAVRKETSNGKEYNRIAGHRFD